LAISIDLWQDISSAKKKCGRASQNYTARHRREVALVRLTLAAALPD